MAGRFGPGIGEAELVSPGCVKGEEGREQKKTPQKKPMFWLRSTSVYIYIRVPMSGSCGSIVVITGPRSWRKGGLLAAKKRGFLLFFFYSLVFCTVPLAASQLGGGRNG